MPDTRSSLIKTCAGHSIFLWSAFSLPLVCVCVCGRKKKKKAPAGVEVCAMCAQGAANSAAKPGRQARRCTEHPRCQSVSVRRRNPDTPRKPVWERRILNSLSHVLGKPQVNRLALTADYISREKTLEVGALFHNRPKQREYYLPPFLFPPGAPGPSSRSPTRHSLGALF